MITYQLPPLIKEFIPAYVKFFGINPLEVMSTYKDTIYKGFKCYIEVVMKAKEMKNTLVLQYLESPSLPLLERNNIKILNRFLSSQKNQERDTFYREFLCGEKKEMEENSLLAKKFRNHLTAFYNRILMVEAYEDYQSLDKLIKEIHQIKDKAEANSQEENIVISELGGLIVSYPQYFPFEDFEELSSDSEDVELLKEMLRLYKNQVDIKAMERAEEWEQGKRKGISQEELLTQLNLAS